MASTESRLKALIAEHLDLDHEPGMGGGFTDAGVSSMDAVAFIRIVEKDFGIVVPPEDCSKITSFQALVAYIDEKSG